VATGVPLQLRRNETREFSVLVHGGAKQAATTETIQLYVDTASSPVLLQIFLD
jgi:hypothetical protein